MIENNNLPYDKNLLIIGGSGKNVGKTTFALSLISKVSTKIQVIGLKVSTHKQGEELFHGSHGTMLSNDYRITTETRKIPRKDTALMLDAGASSSYYIEVAGNKVLEAYNEFMTQYNVNGFPVVCESRTLRNHVKPGLFILLVNKNEIKPDTNHYMSLADHIHYYDNDITRLHQLTDAITFGPEGWKLK